MADPKGSSTVTMLLQRSSSFFSKYGKNSEGYWAHAAALTLFVLIVLMMFPRGKSYEFSNLKEGEVYVGDQIVAPFTFSIDKSKEEYERDVEEARKSVSPIFVRVDTIARKQEKKLVRLLESLETAIFSNAPDSVRGTVINELLVSAGIPISDEMTHFYMAFKDRDANSQQSDTTQVSFREFKEKLVTIAKDLYSFGVLNVAPDDLPNDPAQIAVHSGNEMTVEDISRYHNIETISDAIVKKIRNNLVGDNAIHAGYDILTTLITPNIFYDEVKTSEKIRQAILRVPRAKGTVLENEKIIGSNERITSEHIRKLKSLAEAKAVREGSRNKLFLVRPLIGKIILISMSLSFILFYLIIAAPGIFRDFKKLLMILISMLLVIFIAHFVNNFFWSEYLIPVAISSMLLTIFFNPSLAFVGTVSVALLLGGMRGNEFSICLTTMVVGSIGILSVRKVRSRSWLFKSILWLTAGYILIISTLDLLRFTPFDEFSLNLMFGLLAGFLSPILTYGLMVIFEYLFDMTTDATLLELSDLNKPLLRKLAMRAPGTYHHSILVGSLSEAAAEAIGANSLLTRVGAYYHDIGKMDKPEYFIENQKDGRNPHEKLSPSMSYLILVSHVKRGLEIAQEYNLPKEIQAFISEHHGTNLMEYFYNKAKEKSGEDTEVSEVDFRYPGPKPQSKETGIVMLADAVEATSRTLKEPSVSRLRNMVAEIIDNRFKSCELDESPLTLRDLNLIQEAFVQILTGIFHGRIEYPNQKEENGRSETAGTEENTEKKKKGRDDRNIESEPASAN